MAPLFYQFVDARLSQHYPDATQNQLVRWREIDVCVQTYATTWSKTFFPEWTGKLFRFGEQTLDCQDAARYAYHADKWLFNDPGKTYDKFQQRSQAWDELEPQAKMCTLPVDVMDTCRLLAAFGHPRHFFYFGLKQITTVDDAVHAIDPMEVEPSVAEGQSYGDGSASASTDVAPPAQTTRTLKAKHRDPIFRTYTIGLSDATYEGPNESIMFGTPIFLNVSKDTRQSMKNSNCIPYFKFMPEDSYWVTLPDKLS